MRFLDVDVVTDCTVLCSDLATFIIMPYAYTYLLPHGGLFVRVNTRSGYQLARIKEIVPSAPYRVSDRDIRFVDAKLKLDTLPDTVNLCSISNKRPSAEEVEQYEILSGINADTAAAVTSELQLLRENIRKMRNHVPSADEARIIIEKNTKLSRATNPVVEYAALQRQQMFDAGSLEQDLSEGLISPSRSTVALGEVFSSPPSRLATLTRQISNYVEAGTRCKESEHLRVLTERNKALNDESAARAAKNYGAKHGPFAQGALCWEIDDEKRAQLCEEKEGVAAEQANEKTAEATRVTRQPTAEELRAKRIAEATDDFGRLHSFSFDELEVVDPETLTVERNSSAMLLALNTKRDRSGSRIPPTQDVM